MSECLTLNISYDVNEDKFETDGNLNNEGITEIVGEFLRRQLGAGRDDTKYEERGVYHIQLRWSPENDAIEARSDTGNKALRDGLLMRYLKTSQI